MKQLLLLLPLAVLLALAVLAARIAWNSAGDAEIDLHGVVAMLLGIACTLILTAVLVGLLLYSRRRGFDDIDR